MKQFFHQLFILNLRFRIYKSILMIQRNNPYFSLSKFIWHAAKFAFLTSFWMIESRCTGNSFKSISKILFVYYSVVNRLHFIKQKFGSKCTRYLKITKNLVPEQTRHPVELRQQKNNPILKKYWVILWTTVFYSCS